MGRHGDGETRRRGDGETGRRGDGETGRWGDGEMGRWGDEYSASCLLPAPYSLLPPQTLILGVFN
ncbi:MAG: hypothetical protein F6K58_05130 [Symploca sp. SIO2E9]|nr:hypothetical protein [Symploca sp. SIO2E9]